MKIDPQEQIKGFHQNLKLLRKSHKCKQLLGWGCRDCQRLTDIRVTTYYHEMLQDLIASDYGK